PGYWRSCIDHFAGSGSRRRTGIGSRRSGRSVPHRPSADARGVTVSRICGVLTVRSNAGGIGMASGRTRLGGASIMSVQTQQTAQSPVIAHGTRRISRFAVTLAIILLLAAPWTVGDFEIGMLSRILVLGLVAMSVALLTGVTGLPTLAQAGYFGVGAYTAAIIARSLSAVGLVQLVLGMVVAALVAAVTSVVLVRARGVAFLMITLALGEIMYTAAESWSGVTGGTDGLSGIPPVIPIWGMPPLTLTGLVYYYVVAVFGLLFILLALLVRSPFGLALRGIRDNEARMRASGYPVARYVTVGYCIAGAIAGGAGVLWVNLHRFMSPGEMGFELAALTLLAAVIGGGSMWGASVGAALVVLMRDYVGGFFAGQGMLLLGVMFVIVVYLLPRGISGFTLPKRSSQGVDAT